MGMVMSQKMQVTGGLLGHDLGKGAAFPLGVGLAARASELQGQVWFKYFFGANPSL